MRKKNEVLTMMKTMFLFGGLLILPFSPFSSRVVAVSSFPSTLVRVGTSESSSRAFPFFDVVDFFVLEIVKEELFLFEFFPQSRSKDLSEQHFVVSSGCKRFLLLFLSQTSRNRTKFHQFCLPSSSKRCTTLRVRELRRVLI